MGYTPINTWASQGDQPLKREEKQLENLQARITTNSSISGLQKPGRRARCEEEGGVGGCHR